MLRGLNDRVPLNQNILVAELALWIAAGWRISMLLDTELKIENLGGTAQRLVDFALCPNIERAFRVFRFSSCDKAVRIFGRKKSPILRRQIAPDVIENVARDAFELPILLATGRVRPTGGRDLKCIEIG